jgi:hypothetical protein
MLIEMDAHNLIRGLEIRSDVLCPFHDSKSANSGTRDTLAFYPKVEKQTEEWQ